MQGAITILPESEIPESPAQYKYRSLSDDQLANLIKNIPKHPLLAGKEGVRISLAGAQEKLALFYKAPFFYIPLNGAPSNCIIKPAMAHFHSSIENEYFCMKLANAVGLNTPCVKIIRKQTQQALLVNRYDRISDNDVVKRIHQEDFCQAMGISHELKYQADGGPGLKSRFAEEIKIHPQVLQKQLSDFCVKLVNRIDGVYANFNGEYHQNKLVDNIIAIIKQRADRTLEQCDAI